MTDRLESLKQNQNASPKHNATEKFHSLSHSSCRLHNSYRDNKKRACLLHPCSLVRPTKAIAENMGAKDTPGTRMCHTARPSQDMSFSLFVGQFHQNEQVRVVTRSFYLYYRAYGVARAPLKFAAILSHDFIILSKIKFLV